MGYRPFLSHKREDAGDVGLLKQQLRLRGAGGWQDVDDLRLGQRLTAAFKRAVGRETGGFIWWGTRQALTSRTICRVEIPGALRRQRRSRGVYPVVPLFVDVAPDADRNAIENAVGRRRGGRLCALNGLVREQEESTVDFATRAARRYVGDLVRGHPRDELRVAITGGREPAAQHDLVLDWRDVLDEYGRPRERATVPQLVETLGDVRVAAQSRAQIPRITVEPHLRLPLAALVGWEWNRVRPVDLAVVQTSPGGSIVIPDRLVGADPLPAPSVVSFDRDGCEVIALSVGKALGEATWQYAEAVGAGSAVHLHLPGHLDADGICAAARWAVEQLAAANARAVEKHLLLLGPAGLAVRIGAAANGTGKTFIPFWDGGSGYEGGIVIG